MRRLTIFVLLMALVPSSVYCWGFYGHKRINRMAVFTLPSELMVFYKAHIEFVTEHAVDADMRRYVVEEEAPRHYIDIDHYGESPFEVMPRQWKTAAAKYSEDTLYAYGIVPWHVERMYYRLVKAFKVGDPGFILKTSADLGHYIADAHVPLHTTENYNGQLTNQHGIHGFWESRLPELYADDYDYFTGKASMRMDVLDDIWTAVEASHRAVDSVLSFERALTEEVGSDRKYAFEQRGNTTVKTYSRDFSADYHAMMDGMVERRMRAAIITIGSYWYSAWVEAGKPTVGEGFEPEALDSLEQERARLEALRSANPIMGRQHDD